MAADKALSIVEDTDTSPAAGYLAILSEPDKLLAAVRENMRGEAITLGDLDRVKMPLGGGTLWTVPDLGTDSGTADTREIQGIIIEWASPRAYWKEKYGTAGASQNPDCSSPDGDVGYGDNGEGPGTHSCEGCPQAQFGSDGRRGQACNQKRTLFMVRPDDILPMIVDLPATSIKPLRKYFLRLAAQGLPFYAAVTGLSLAKTANADNIAYSEVQPRLVAKLTDTQTERIRQLSEALRPSLQRRLYSDAT